MPGAFERFRVVCYGLGFHNTVAIHARYTRQPPIQSPVRSLVFQALHVAIRQNPALSATVVDSESSEPYFAHIEELCLDEIITFMDVP